MKKRYFIITTALLSLIFSSCEISFLDSASYSDITKDDYYKSLSEYETALVGCYYYISGRGNNKDGNYASGIPIAGQAGTDETYIAVNKGVNFESATQFDNYSTLNPNNLICQEVWLNHYAGINAANEIINRIDKMDSETLIESPRYLGIRAESQFLEALWYFNLVRIFGGVPIVTKASDSSMELYSVKRDSMKNVYTHIINLLDSANKFLPTTTTEYGRATVYSGYGLLSKVALHIASSMNLLTIPEEVKLGGINSYDWLVKNENGNVLSKNETIKYYYQIARDNAMNVLTHFAPSYLMPNYTDCFYPHESSKEILFEAIMSTGLSQEEGGWFGSLFGPKGPTSFGGGQHVIMPILPIVMDHFTFSYPATTTSTYSSLDSRFMWSIATFQYSTTNGSLSNIATASAYKLCEIGKFRIDAPPGYNQDRTPVNNPILRVSEICLIYAEAQAEIDNINGLGITEEALRYLNIVRARAQVPLYTTTSIKNVVSLTVPTLGNKEIKGYTTTTDIEHVRRAILNERMVELLGEGHRWFDLVRMGLLKPVAEQSASYANTVDNKVVLKNIQPYNIFRPIPMREISIHKGNLIQNYGYN